MSEHEVRMIVLSTDDLDESIRFYNDTLGMGGYLVEYGDTHQIFENPREKHTMDYIAGAFS